jgi:hypothetical protein
LWQPWATTKMPAPVVHKDILGNEIKLGDTVVYPSHNALKIAFVKKINPKMINVIGVGRSWVDRKYPTDLLVVNDPKITLYLLKNSK